MKLNKFLKKLIEDSEMDDLRKQFVWPGSIKEKPLATSQESELKQKSKKNVLDVLKKVSKFYSEKAYPIVKDAIDNKSSLKFRETSSTHGGEYDDLEVLEIKSQHGVCAFVKEPIDSTAWILDSIAEFKSIQKEWDEEGDSKTEFSPIASLSREEAIEWLNDISEFHEQDFGSWG
jgi:hypothetical protein